MPLIQETDAEYHARTEISNSWLGDMEPPYRFFQKHLASEPVVVPSTPSQIEGAAMHMMLLEPDQFSERFVIEPKGTERRSKKGKQAWADFLDEKRWYEAIYGTGERSVITQSQADKCARRAEAVFDHPYAAELLRSAGLHELTVLFDYPKTDIKCRGRIDKLLINRRAIVDIKGAKDASPWGFQRAVTNYEYHRQAMWYGGALEASGDPRCAGASDWPFFWIAIEPQPPHCVGVYTMDEKQRKRGRELYETAFETMLLCAKHEDWPHYTRDAEILHLPPWAYTDFEATEVIG